MIVVTVANVVTVSDQCESDSCDCFGCYSLLAIVPVVSPVTAFAVLTAKIVVTVSRVIMCILNVGMKRYRANKYWRAKYTRRVQLTKTAREPSVDMHVGRQAFVA